ncbi:ADP-ribosyltransferase-containing protein [Inhella gelatinilytica]|uniref:ART-PolyVal-like domain-containing protein n=1 Tax=Inhella gelatinilytica TaxID=2795030 RepID=A0A931NDZ2_9BURK|nr:hypothetical protein [Inhella gelatinilytica]MBH9553144.1 hypothetical protein [Inhella gelatinilytica]
MAVKAIEQALPNGPKINLLESIDDAPAGLRSEIIERGAQNDVEAVYWGGEIYAFPNHFADVERFNFVVGRHEVRHAGWDAMLGDKRNGIMEDIGRTNRRVALRARALMDSKNGPKNFAEAVEEVLADLPVSEVAALSRIRVLTNAVRQWLRSVAVKLRKAGFAKLADSLEPRTWTDSEVIAFVKKAEDISRGPGGPGGARFSRDSGESDEFNRTAIEAGGESAYALAHKEGRTELTYRQWVQVRTPSFKKWWGYDWEKTDVRGTEGRISGATERGQAFGVDGTASRGFPFLHERTKEPRVFFHGTRDAFTAFEVDHPNKKDHGWLGIGHYVSSDEWIADRYSRAKRGVGKPHVMALFVRPNNPVELLPRHKEILARARPADVAVITDEWREAGNGGSMMVYEDGSVELAVFEANGLKSATDNTGQFSESRDIRFSRRPATLETVRDAVMGKVEAFKQLELLAGRKVGDYLTTTGTLSWWDESVGTPFNLAQKHPKTFGPVFNGVQNFLRDVSFYATEAAKLAPTLLPTLEEFKDTLKQAISPEDNKAIKAPIFEGTLVWTRDADGRPVRMDTTRCSRRALRGSRSNEFLCSRLGNDARPPSRIQS